MLAGCYLDCPAYGIDRYLLCNPTSLHNRRSVDPERRPAAASERALASLINELALAGHGTLIGVVECAHNFGVEIGQLQIVQPGRLAQFLPHF